MNKLTSELLTSVEDMATINSAALRPNYWEIEKNLKSQFVVQGSCSLAVSQTVSQNRALDLFNDSAKVLIRLKVRTQVVPQEGIELRPRAPLS